MYQIDLVPTLSIYLGLPIPVNNLGVLLPNSLDDYDISDQLQAYYSNMQQIAGLYQESIDNYDRGTATLVKRLVGLGYLYDNTTNSLDN